MAPSNITLDEFLRELATQRGMHRKVRLIGRYWRQIQSLPSAERERVALALGSEAAWRRLERLFRQDGTLSEGELEVKRALDSVGRADPRELRDLARRIRAGDYADVGRDLTEVLGRALEEEATEADEPASSGPVDLDLPAPEPIEAADEIGPAVPEEIAEEPEPPFPGDVVAVAGPFAHAVTTDEPEPAAHAETVGEPERVEPTEAVEPIHPAEASAEPETTDRDPTADGPRRDPADAVLSAAERLRVLRQLRGKDGLAVRLGRDGRARLLQRLGPGWAARRALSQLIRSRQVDGLDEALWLTQRLSTPIQRTWCLGDLVEHWDLDDDAIARVLAAAPTPASRRRLERRAHRAGSSGR